MNKKFYELSLEKQNRIKQAGYKAFGENVYKKSSMQLIADEANISKSLLFHYFRNKQTLYEWLFKSALADLSETYQPSFISGVDFFELIRDVISNRLSLLKTHTLPYQFILKSYDEFSQNSFDQIGQTFKAKVLERKQKVLGCIDRKKFENEQDIEVLYDMINDLAVGYYQRFKDEDWSHDSKSVILFDSYLISLKMHYYKEEYK